MANKVTIRQLENLSGYYEFDYKNPLANQRIRRKIKATTYQGELLKELLEHVLDNSLDEDDTYQLIKTNETFAPYSNYLMESISLVYFGYLNNQSYNLYETELLRNKLLDSLFSLRNYNANYCFLGKAGVGKSTIIRKLSPFCENEDLPFPFTDTSRTTTFPADYCFVPRNKGFKFLVVLKPAKEIELNIIDCIERAINKMMDQKTKNTDNSNTAMDEVFSAFTTDPSQSFDIRYSLGRYIKTTSPAYAKEENQETIRFWHNLYYQFRDLIGVLNISSDESDSESALYKQRISDALKCSNSSNSIFDIYSYILELINQRIISVRNKLIGEIENLSIIKELNTKFDDEDIPYISCNITEIKSEEFSKFIQIFTTKGSTFFGRSLFNIVSHLRIELPLNQNIHPSKREDFSFVVQDTIGIAHSNDNGGGFENSTALRTDDLDALVLVDDSRLNGDTNISSILEHLVARMNPERFIFAFNFFELLNKADFDCEDDLTEQRINYLRSTQENTISNVLKNSVHVKTLINKLSTSDTVFMQGLMNIHDYTSINRLLDSLINITYRYNSEYSLYKKDPKKKAVVYDYRKLPLLYASAVDSFYSLQNKIYMMNPPHFKTTEALTLRLSMGIRSFNGARLLTPVDDLYNQIITTFSNFIDQPEEINFNSANKDITDLVVNELKGLISEKLRNTVNNKFFSQKFLEVWNRLYQYYGPGSDYKRRSGIITTEGEIAPNINSYLNSTVKYHIIDSIEDAINESITYIEEKYKIN